MSRMAISPMRSPNKQKPRISLKCYPSQMQQKKTLIGQIKTQKYLRSPRGEKMDGQMKWSNLSPKMVENRSPRYNFQSFQIMKDELRKFEREIRKDHQQFDCQKCTTTDKRSCEVLSSRGMKFKNCAIGSVNLNGGKQLNQQNEKITQMQQKIRRAKNERESFLKKEQKPDNQIEKDGQRLIELINSVMDEERVGQDYDRKRQQLKKHYEKLKQVIQMAIKKDLQNLKLKQQSELADIRNKKIQLVGQIHQLVSEKERIGNIGVKENVRLSFNIKEEMGKIRKVVQSFNRMDNLCGFDIKPMLYNVEMFMLVGKIQRKLTSQTETGRINTQELLLQQSSNYTNRMIPIRAKSFISPPKVPSHQPYGKIQFSFSPSHQILTYQ